MIDLTNFNTLKVSAKAKDLIELTDASQLKNISGEVLFLGHGANVLFTKDFDGTVVHVNLKGKKIISENDEEVIVEAAAGEDWHEFVMWTAQNGWWGLQNMAYIPGSVGAAPHGNIAAYGGNQEDVFMKLQAINLKSQKEEEFTKEQCQFKYRESIFKHQKNYLITKVFYKLSKKYLGDINYHSRFESLSEELKKLGKLPDSPLNIAEAVISLRKIKQPNWTKVGTAGSFFKNPIVSKDKYLELSNRVKELQWYPVDKLQYTNTEQLPSQVKIPAARLLDELGWRNKIIGQVSTYERQALVIINLGGATGQEIFNYAELMRADVKKNFGIELEYEVLVI